MEAIVNLKRSTRVSLSLCIICQEERPDIVYNATEKGLGTLLEITHERQKLRDAKSRDTVDRLLKVLNEDSRSDICWHRICYATYTSKERLSRLKHANMKESGNACHTPSTSSSTECQPPRMNLRSSMQPTNWELCLICQQVKAKQKLISITKLNKSQEILEAAKLDQEISVRVANVDDLIAAGGKYHLSCYVQFTRRTNQTREMSQHTDIAMVRLRNELKNSADHGHMLELKEVWNRYCTIAEEFSLDIPQSFMSRLGTFKDKLAPYISEFYEIVVLHEKAPNGRSCVLVPLKYNHIPVSKIVEAEEETSSTLTIPTYRPQEDDFLSMIHVALKLRGDILSHPTYNGLNISEDDATECVPDSLYMFLNLMIGGPCQLEQDAQDGSSEDRDKSVRHCRVLSLAQDLIYTVSGDKYLTPKHIGLGSTLHQSTRSKELVKLFHNAGHVASYRDVLRLDTALAERTLQSMDASGAVIPPNLVKDKFVLFSADNIDINEGTLDGRTTFHATQMAVWQRGPPSGSLLDGIRLSSNDTVNVPNAMIELIPVATSLKRISQPPLKEKNKKEWFDGSIEESTSAARAQAADTAFMLQRQSQDPKPSWTEFNQKHSTVDPAMTTVGYLPIIQAPAHDIDTLNTVVRRALHITQALEQKYVVLSVDEALFPKLMELKWSVPEYENILIPRLGGLHTSMNFLRVIGQHMQDSGLTDVWIESGILGANAAQHVMGGKAYARGIRIHKMTLQALWQLLIPQLYDFLEERNQELKDKVQGIVQAANFEFAEAQQFLSSEQFSQHVDAFRMKLQEKDSTVQFWLQYMDMVSVLLMFVRAQRDGVWDLHIFAFRRMLPYFFRYDHTHYARWGAIYLKEMNHLPPEVLQEFQNGNFVVKESQRRFNQVDPDHSQEWLNGTGKKSGGIVGITRTITALSRWALSFNLRSYIST